MQNEIFRKSMVLAIIVLFVTSTHFSGSARTYNLTNTCSNNGISIPMFIRIYSKMNIDNLPLEIEIVSEKPGEWIDIIISDERLDELSEYNYEIIIQDLRDYENIIRRDYHTLAEIESILQNIADDFPDITSLYSIGKTYENRDIWCLEITDNPGIDEGEPGIVFTGLHHACEWPSVEICLYIADQLTSQYSSNQTITNLVNNRRLWLISCVNPDGYYYSHDDPGDENWRKNRQPYGSYIGVDPNRNYNGSCDGNMWGAWGSIGDMFILYNEGTVSHDPYSYMYCGPGPCSEKETQAIVSLFIENDICASINWHTCGEMVLWPWGYTTDTTPDNSYLESVGTEIARNITKMYNSKKTYDPKQSCNLNKVTGGLNDWSYGYGLYVKGKPIFSYTIEACSLISFSGSSFHPNAIHLDQICAENFNGALCLLKEAENIKNVSPRVLPPIIDDMTYDADGNYIVSWEEQNPDANPDYFQLEELTNISYKIDDVENKQDVNWSYTIGKSVTSTPAIYNGRVYVGSWDYKIYCLNAENGDFIWEYKTGDIVHSSPTVVDGRVYVGSKDKKIYCLNADTGDIVWSYLTGGDVLSSPAVFNGRVYIGSYDGKFYCLNADNGDFIWDYPIGGQMKSSPAVVDGKVYVGSKNKKIYCLNADNGDFIWSYLTGDHVESSPAVVNGRVYVGSNDNNIYCLNASNGSVIWRYTTGNSVKSSPAVKNNRVFIGSGDYKIYCLEAENGDSIWNYTTGGCILSSPEIAHGRVFVGSEDNNIYCLDAITGNLKWNYTTNSFIESSPVVAKNKVYIGSGNSENKIYCLFTFRLWSFDGFNKKKDKDSHSGDYCYYSQLNKIQVSSMRTAEPVPVPKDSFISFWCKYDIYNWDKVFVEASKDGRCYDIIDTFNGSSNNNWIYKTYSLDDYEDESIFIRFRCSGDEDITPLSYFYIDDILPIADIGSITILSNSIIDNQYTINGRAPGVYFYRIRGFKNERGWGDFSTLEGITIGTNPPNKPTIDGPSSGRTGKKYTYIISAEDPENHKVSYKIKWGDGKSEGWTDYVESGEEITIEHTWTENGNYSICAKAKDIYGAESNWAELEVRMPRNKQNIYKTFSNFQKRHLYMFPKFR